MNKRIIIMLGALLGFLSTAVFANPVYLPTGVQTNVSLLTIAGGGWTQCYVASMGTPIGDHAENVLNACTEDYLMMAGRQTGSDQFMSLAAALRADTIMDTGHTSNTHLANGSEWWFSDNWSWGFTEAGDTVSNNECDVGDSPQSMCLHTFSWVGGYRINNISGLNDSNDYEKVFFQANASQNVPEPGSIALMFVALAALGFASRRRKF